MINYNNLIGIPFVGNGDDKTGIDCFNLMRAAFAKHGINVPATNISVCACQEASDKEIYKNLSKSWSKLKHPENPCGVLILSSDPNFANHIGVFIGDNRLLHITKNTNSVIERMYPKYKTRIVGFYKYIEDI